VATQKISSELLKAHHRVLRSELKHVLNSNNSDTIQNNAIQFQQDNYGSLPENPSKKRLTELQFKWLEANKGVWPAEPEIALKQQIIERGLLAELVNLEKSISSLQLSK
jgi:hypothetical protein